MNNYEIEISRLMSVICNDNVCRTAEMIVKYIENYFAELYKNTNHARIAKRVILGSMGQFLLLEEKICSCWNWYDTKPFNTSFVIEIYYYWGLGVQSVQLIKC